MIPNINPKVEVQMTCYRFLILFSFQSYKGLKIGKMVEKMVQRSAKNQSKMIKSVTSCGRHLDRVHGFINVLQLSKYLSE